VNDVVEVTTEQQDADARPPLTSIHDIERAARPELFKADRLC